jgi:hypothetical protein
VVEGGLSGLLEDPGHAWREETATAFVAVAQIEPDEAPQYYVFDRRRWLELAARLTRFEVTFDIEDLARMLPLEELRAEIVEPGGAPEGPAIAMEGERIVDAWVPTPAAPSLEHPWLPDYLEDLTAGQEQVLDQPAYYGDPAAEPSGDALTTVNAIETEQPETPAEVRTYGEHIRRTPQLDVPDALPEAGGTFEVLVYTDKAPPRAGETSKGIVLSADREVFKFTVWLLASERHFEIEGDRSTTLTVHRGEERSDDVAFSLRVRDGVTSFHNASIAAVFLFEGRPAGWVERSLAPGGETEEGPQEVGALPFAEPPDLTVPVSRARDGHGWECLVTTELIPSLQRHSGWPVQDADALVAQRMSNFAKSGLTPKQRLAALVGAGETLYEDAPEAFRKVFEELRQRPGDASCGRS